MIESTFSCCHTSVNLEFMRIFCILFFGGVPLSEKGSLENFPSASTCALDCPILAPDDDSLSIPIFVPGGSSVCPEITIAPLEVRVAEISEIMDCVFSGGSL